MDSYAINKKSSTFERSNDETKGSKRSLVAIMQYIQTYLSHSQPQQAGKDDHIKEGCTKVPSSSTSSTSFQDPIHLWNAICDIRGFQHNCNLKLQ